MSNYENIRQYAEHIHDVAQKGGVDKYLQEFAEANYIQGVMDEKETEGKKVVIAVGLTLGIWEGGKYLYRSIKNFREKRKVEAIHKAELAKKAISQGMEKEEVQREVEE